MQNHGTDLKASTPRQHAIFTGVLAGAVADANLPFDFMQELNGNKRVQAKAVKDVLRALKVEETSPAPHALLEKYHREVYGQHVNLWGLQFPQKDGMTTYMAVPEELDDEDWIARRLVKQFGVGSSAYKVRVADNINRELEQKRPEGFYVFADRGGDEPDDIHRNKSYDDAMEQNLTFLNPKEYLLVSGFHRYVNEHFMDRKGWTCTSSLWLDGGLVGGGWCGTGVGLCLSVGDRGNRGPARGPREAVFA